MGQTQTQVRNDSFTMQAIDFDAAKIYVSDCEMQCRVYKIDSYLNIFPSRDADFRHFENAVKALGLDDARMVLMSSGLEMCAGLTNGELSRWVSGKGHIIYQLRDQSFVKLVFLY